MVNRNSEKRVDDRLSKKLIKVSEPFLPPLSEFVPYLEQIWDSRTLTNNGPYHREFEAELCRHLDVPHISVFANGTLALVVALQALRISGEAITSPFSFAATTHALQWNGITPVFADIDAQTLTLDPEKIEAAITPRTTAIVPVHVYGQPCAVDTIGRIADAYGLKVIYDAAHTFGVRTGTHALAAFGDLSILSFHATKVFNTFEGGAIVSHSPQMKQRIDYLKNFGFANEVTVVAPGINAKMNEFQAALGLLQLRHVDEALRARQRADRRYREGLTGISGLRLLAAADDVDRNYAYFPVFVDPEFPLDRDALYEYLKTFGVMARRYFYPLISEFPSYRGLPSAAPDHLPVATEVSRRVLCLPIHPNLDDADQDVVIAAIRAAATGAGAGSRV